MAIKEVTKIFDFAGWEKDKSLTFLDFFSANIDLKKSLTQNHINYLFSTIDANNDQYIEKKELRDFFQLGQSFEDEELLESMIGEADTNNDNLISLDEFKKIVSAFYDNLIDK